MAIDPAIEAAIGRVPWSTMDHCRGSATDLPELLRTMLDAKLASDRAEARRSLWSAIQHQGSVFEPAAHVIPILARALPTAPPDDRARIVAMLGNLAYAYTMTEGQGLLRIVAENDPDRAGIMAQLRREQGWVRAAQRASWTARDVLVQLLARTEDQDLLVHIPFALVALLDGAGEGAPTAVDLDATARGFALEIAARARRPATDQAHAGFAFALGRLAQRVPDLLPALRASLDRAPWPARVTAAVGVLRVSPRDERATDVLIEGLRRRAEHQDWLPRPFPWITGHLRFLVIAVLASDRVSDAGFSRALPVLADVARYDASQWTFHSDALAPLARAFDGAVAGPGTRRADLPHAALKLLDALHENPDMWSTRVGNVDNALHAFGLVNDVTFWDTMLAR
ncbi:Hypothetical protein A7982_05969 [Minicystis rosea]|nr:Hypothetical protein A7982_05969 [Minicystis rosea]